MKAVAGVLLVLFAAAPVAAQTGSTLVTISVPPTQVLEGATSVAVTPGSSPRARLVVKSNTAWTLVARVSGNVGGVAWRPESGAWVQIDGTTAVLRGGRGVHVIDYQIRAQTGQQGTVLFVLEPR